MKINTGAGLNLLQNKNINPKMQIDTSKIIQLTGKNEHPVFTLGQTKFEIFGYSTTFNNIPNEILVEED